MKRLHSPCYEFHASCGRIISQPRSCR